MYVEVAASRMFVVFAARRRASTVYAIVVHVSLCLSQVGVLLKRLNGGSRKQCHTIAQAFKFFDAEDLGKIKTVSLPTKMRNADGVG